MREKTLCKACAYFAPLPVREDRKSAYLRASRGLTGDCLCVNQPREVVTGGYFCEYGVDNTETED